MRVMGIDPSIQACGIALIVNGRVREAMCLRAPREFKGKKAGLKGFDWMEEQVIVAVKEWAPDVVVIEQPQIMQSLRGDMATQSGSIVKLIGIAFAIRSRCSVLGYSVVFPRVSKWKGTCPKAITQKRMLERYKIKGDHNLIDAVGLADWYIRKSGLCTGSRA